MTKSSVPPQGIEEKLKEFNERIDVLKEQLILCYRIKEAKVPSYEKLPKDHMYYKHYMQKIEYMKMKNEVSGKTAENRHMFEQAAEKLRQDAEQARDGSPQYRHKKRAPFKERKSAQQLMLQV